METITSEIAMLLLAWITREIAGYLGQSRKIRKVVAENTEQIKRIHDHINPPKVKRYNK